MKFDIMPYDLEENIAYLMEKSNISELNRKITYDILAKYSEYLMKDIQQSFLDLQNDINKYFTEIRSNNIAILKTSTKSIEEIRADYDKSKQELEEIQSYKEQLEITLDAVKSNTKERVDNLCKQLLEMAK